MTGATDGRGDTTLSELFEILNHEYRRHILWVLADSDVGADGTVEPAGITDADWAVGADGEPDVLRLELVHNHFPKLDDHGFVDWDPEAKTLTRGPRFEEIEPLLRVLNDNRDEISQNWP